MRTFGLRFDVNCSILFTELPVTARAASKVGASVLVEAINPVDVPPAQYHLAKMGEDVVDVLDRYRDTIAHVQVADPPGRGAPGTGTLDFEPLFAQLAEQGYDGWVGLEYVPGDAADSTGSFGWLREKAEQ